MRKQQGGFTLIELIVVIVILGILAAVAVPRFMDLAGNARTTASEAAQGAIRSAMAIAYARHRAANLTVSGAGDSLYITDCASLATYMEGGAFPGGTTCAGTTITYQDGLTAAISAETNVAAATVPNRS